METVANHPDPGLRPRLYDDSYDGVFRACVRAMEEMHTIELAEADPRRGVVEGWVKLAPFAGLPIAPPGEVRRPKHAQARGKGWFERFDPRLAQGWVQVRVEPADKGRVRVSAHLRLQLPFASMLAGLLLKNYLNWLDIRRGEPVKPGVLF